MIKIYSKQNLNNQDVIVSPDDVHTTEQEWWFVYDSTVNQITLSPLQCSGYTSSPLTMVVADTKEELEQYIIDNNLILPDPLLSE